MNFFADGLHAEVRGILVGSPSLLFDNSIKDFKCEKRGRVSLIELHGCQYIVKHYYVKSCLFWFRRALLSSLAQKAHEQVALIEQKGFSTPKLLAAVDHGWGVGYQGTTCVYEYIKPAKDLDRLQADFANPVKRRFIVESAISLLARMHKSGIYHGDAKISNFLWVERHGKVDLHVIDLHDCLLMSEVSNQRRLADLSTLVFSFAWWWSDQNFVLECLNVYLNVDSSWCDDKEAVFVAVKKRVVKKLVHRKARQK